MLTAFFFVPNELHNMARPIPLSSPIKHRHCMASKLPANITVFMDALDPYIYKNR